MFSESPTARRFGAKIDVTMPGDGLFFVTFRDQRARAVLTQAGGRIVYSIGVDKVLTLLPLNRYFAVRAEDSIAFIGPVSLDQQRYARVMSLLTGARPTPEQE